jgi:hypothetical protein
MTMVRGVKVTTKGLFFTWSNLGFPQFILFRTLGLCVVAAEAPRENHLLLLNSVWKVVSRLSDVGHYAACAEVWIEFAAKYFGVNFHF